MGFLRSMEGAIENADAAVGVTLIAVWPIRRESGADTRDVVRGGRLTVEIPNSKLDTHVRALSHILRIVSISAFKNVSATFLFGDGAPRSTRSKQKTDGSFCD